MIELFSLPFMQRALIAALLSGLLAPAIGIFIVQRRLSLLGDGLGHIAVMGVGLALLTNSAPLPLAIITATVAAAAVELLRQHGKASGDLGLAVLFYGGIASGVMMAGIAGQGAAGLTAFLFGSLTSVTETDLLVIATLGVVILIVTIGLLPRLFAAVADEDFAQVQGLRPRLLNLLTVVLAALTVTLSMRTVGLLLISALMVLPVAASQQLFAGFKASFYGAMGIGVLAALLGVGGSYYLDSAPGATIVVVAIVLLGVSWAASGPLRRARNFIPYVPEHDHNGHRVAASHGDAPPPGARTIQHGDHLDYVHNGHRHARHGDHYDEH